MKLDTIDRWIAAFGRVQERKRTTAQTRLIELVSARARSLAVVPVPISPAALKSKAAPSKKTVSQVTERLSEITLAQAQREICVVLGWPPYAKKCQLPGSPVADKKPSGWELARAAKMLIRLYDAPDLHPLTADKANKLLQYGGNSELQKEVERIRQRKRQDLWLDLPRYTLPAGVEGVESDVWKGISSDLEDAGLTTIEGSDLEHSDEFYSGDYWYDAYPSDEIHYNTRKLVHSYNVKNKHFEPDAAYSERLFSHQRETKPTYGRYGRKPEQIKQGKRWPYETRHISWKEKFNPDAVEGTSNLKLGVTQARGHHDERLGLTPAAARRESLRYPRTDSPFAVYDFLKRAREAWDEWSETECGREFARMDHPEYKDG